ncbi:MAG: hypothetical protein WCK86_11405 [Planctomycetia bacterium]
METEYPITIVFSAYVPTSAAENTKSTIFSFNDNLRDTAVDNRQFDLTAGNVVVQGYFHFRANTRDALTAAIAKQRENFEKMQTKIREDIEEEFFTSFSQHWFSQPNCISGTDFGISSSDLPPATTALTADLGAGRSATIHFVTRPSPTSRFPTAITVIEVPKETEEGFALGLAFHKQRAFETPLCILELLCSKACWLQHNMAFPFPAIGATAATTLEQMLSDKFQTARSLMGAIFQDAASTRRENLISLSKTICEASVIASALKMTEAMLVVVHSQIRELDKRFPKYNLSIATGWMESNTFPIHQSINGIERFSDLSKKYLSLFEGIVRANTAAESYHRAASDEFIRKKEKAESARSNFFSQLLGAAALGISVTAIIDNDTAKCIVAACSQNSAAAWPYSLLLRTCACLAGAGIGALLVSITHNFKEAEKKHS